MFTLRLTQSSVGQDRYRVEAALESDKPRQTATAEFAFDFTAQDREDLRWYLEDYLLHAAHEPAEIAARIEARIDELGTNLFKSLFQANDDARDLWATLRDKLNDTRVEITTGVQEATALPWELLRDPKTDTPLALRAAAFVRAAHQTAQKAQLPAQSGGPIRILLVICRPGGGADVPFRSVASRLIKGLSAAAREAFQLDVLRPPTFEELASVLREAKRAGQPYHVVHFDGHGAYVEGPEQEGLAEWLRRLGTVMLSAPRTGSHGYLLFENSELKNNLQLIDGPALGNLLAETSVPVLVLNACRSAHAEAPEKPEQAKEETARPDGNADVHAQVRAFGSLAQEVVDAGVAGVVAMRYNVYVVTAAQFVADLYESLAKGWALGEAVTLGRKQLEAAPNREIAYTPRPLQDWMVPIVYEAAEVQLFPQQTASGAVKITLQAGEAAPVSGHLAKELQNPPDAGFFGRDETLLALDRAFDSEDIVLLHAFAGSGKTSTAAEFARWYQLTGGIRGPVLFTSFEHPKTLAQVLNESIGRVFERQLEQNGIQWLALDDEQRRDVALQVLANIPVLWVWDNVEPIAGFPAGNSPWESADELVGFLRDAQATQANFLLTSRRDERGWLGDLPSRIPMPPMPMQERVQLARALARKHQHHLTDVNVWLPLLRFTQGNPLTVTVLVGQALRDKLTTKAQIAAFVDQLRAGEAAFDDDESEGRSKSLGASLSYGFEHAFSEAERQQLALLHFFQGFVGVDVLRMMGDPEADWCLPEVRGLTREDGIALLDRAAEVGLLTAYGDGFYSIHPALPWFFNNLFEEYYPSLPPHHSIVPSPQQVATYAFIEAIGDMGNFYAEQYTRGNRNAIGALMAEETNLLHARQLARQHKKWDAVIRTMQGFQQLYRHTGRRDEWAQLVKEIVPDFVDLNTDGPLPGREELWDFVTHYRALLAQESRHWEETERLQRTRVQWNRQRATPAISQPLETLDGHQRNSIRTLISSLQRLGDIQRLFKQPDCVLSYKEALDLSKKIDGQNEAAICAYNLGMAHVDIPTLYDLTQAEHWYQLSLDLRDTYDAQGRARCIMELGRVSHRRFQEAQEARQPEAELIIHLNVALQFYFQALDLLPTNAVDDLADVQYKIGGIYAEAGDLDRALPHYRDAIRFCEVAGAIYNAAITRRSVAITLANAGRFVDARDYANAALRNFQTFGDRAAAEIQKTQELIADIERALKKPKN